MRGSHTSTDEDSSRLGFDAVRNGTYESNLEEFAASTFRIGIEILLYPEDKGRKRLQKKVIIYHYI